jgi:hypothetical protein
MARIKMQKPTQAKVEVAIECIYVNKISFGLRAAQNQKCEEQAFLPLGGHPKLQLAAA